MTWSRRAEPGVDGLAARVADLADGLRQARERSDGLELRANITVEAFLLAEAARAVPKQPRLVVVEAPDAYGNLAALVPAAVTALGEQSVLVLARDAASAAHWASRDVRAEVWDPAPGAAQTWSSVLTSAVSVLEHHLWWRTSESLLLRSALSGSEQVQLWHGSTGPLGKDVGLGVMADAPGMWEFADLVTTSVGIDHLVCEAREDERRRRQFVARRHVHDVDFRMVGPLQRERSRGASASGRVLIAPTYPESERGADVLARRLRAYAAAVAADGRAADVQVRLHPWTPEAVRRAAGGLTVMPSEVDLYDVIDQFDVLLTDYSSLAADFLLLGRRVVLDSSDLDAYRSERDLEVVDDLMACCDVGQTAEAAIGLALSDVDRLAGRRHDAAQKRLAAVGAEPGRPTLDLLVERLEAVRSS